MQVFIIIIIINNNFINVMMRTVNGTFYSFIEFYVIHLKNQEVKL